MSNQAELLANAARMFEVGGFEVSGPGEYRRFVLTKNERELIAAGLRLAASAPAGDGGERGALLELLRKFVCEFWVDKPSMEWQRTRCDDGLEMVHNSGDTIFLGDPNHSEPPDTDRFDLIVKLANSTPALLRELASAPAPAVEVREALELARKRVHYLGVAHSDPRHYIDNERIYLPKIDEALSASPREMVQEETPLTKQESPGADRSESETACRPVAYRWRVNGDGHGWHYTESNIGGGHFPYPVQPLCACQSIAKSDGGTESSRASAMAESNRPDDSRAAQAAEQSPDSPRHFQTERLSGQTGMDAGVAPGPSEPSPSSRSETAGECSRWPRAGDKMTFLGKNGYDHELQAAMKVFEVGAEYTVRGCDVGGFRHTISFEGKPGHFNGVMFARIAPDCSGCKPPEGANAKSGGAV